MARHIPHIYVPGPWVGDALGIDDQASGHLERVLRFDGANPVTYTDGNGLVGSGVYSAGTIERASERRVERPPAFSIAAAPPKSIGRVRFLVEKLAELGVARLIWLQSDHSEGRPPRRDKALHWAQGALEQSRGAWLLDIAGPATLAGVEEYGPLVIADRDGVAITSCGPLAGVVLAVGPEGGFSPVEIPPAARRVRLGARVLRVETAAIVGAALLQQESSGTI